MNTLSLAVGPRRPPDLPEMTTTGRSPSVRRQAKQPGRLLEQDDTVNALINVDNDAVIGVDADGLVRLFNRGAERIFSRSAADMRGQGIELLIPERYRTRHRQHLKSFAHTGGNARLMGLRQIVGLRADGREIELEGTLSQVVIHQQLVMIASLRDVTQRNLADLNLERAQTQLQALTRRLMAQERMLVKGMAQVLHDHLGQTIAAIRMAHETILTLQGESIPPKITQLQSQLDKLVGSAVQQVRQVLGDLRPPLLEQQGLIAALDNELRNRSLTHATIDISIHVPSDIAPLRWPGEVEVAAFMVAREAVENAIRHAQASHVSVWLEGSALSLQVSVTDDGVGVNTASALPTAHLDLLSMRERAHAVGAALALDSISTGGTRVSFNWQDAP